MIHVYGPIPPLCLFCTIHSSSFFALMISIIVVQQLYFFAFSISHVNYVYLRPRLALVVHADNIDMLVVIIIEIAHKLIEGVVIGCVIFAVNSREDLVVYCGDHHWVSIFIV